MLTRLDGAAGAADALPVAEDVLARFDAHERDFVPGGNVIESVEFGPIHAERLAGGDGYARNGDVIAGMQMDSGVFRCREFLDFE